MRLPATVLGATTVSRQAGVLVLFLASELRVEVYTQFQNPPGPSTLLLVLLAYRSAPYWVL